MPDDKSSKLSSTRREETSTEQTQREQLLKAREYLDLAEVMFVALSSDGAVEFVNRKFCRALGYDRDEIIGKDWFKTFLPKRFRKETYDVFRNLMKGKIEPVEYFENPVLTKDGEERIIAWHNAVMKNSKSRIDGILSSGEDITERKRAEQAVRKSEERFKSLFEESPIGIDVFDSDGILIEANKACLDVFGLSSVNDIRGFCLFDDPNIPEELKGRIRDGEIVRYQAPFDFEKVKERGLYETSRSGIAYLNNLIAPFGPREDGSFRGYIVQMQDITEHKRAEEALRDSQQLLKRTFDSLSEAILVLDADTVKIVDCNRATETIFGYSRHETLGQTISMLHVDETTYEEFRENLYPAIEEKGFLDRFEFRMRRRDGTVFSTEHSVTPFKNEQGTRVGWVSVIRDITKRKMEEEKLHESEERYRVLVETMNDGLGVIDKNRRFTFVNNCFAEMLGYSPEEMTGQLITDFVDGENLNTLTENIVKRKEGLPSAYELAWTTKTGGEVISIVSGSSLIDRDGNHLGSFAIITDITERKRSEKALRESEQRYKELIDMLPQGVVAADLNERIDLVNKEMCNILGYGYEELMGRSLVDFVDARDAKKMTDQTARRTQGVFSSYDLRMIHKTGEVRDVQVSAAPVRNDAGEIDREIGVFVDVTESKQNEEERRQQHSELEVYAALIRHDLRNDLGIILGNVDLAKMIVGKNDSEILKTLSSTEAACERMVNLLKSVSRPAGSIENNIVTLVRLVSSKAQDAHAKLTVNLTVNDAAEELTIVGNRLFPMVFENLLRNAAAHAGEKPIVDMIISKEGTNVQVIVTDNGHGIPEEVRNHLFHRGASTSGGGLGLYLSREIVNAMNGSIELMDTDPGEGATFRILLPLTM